MDQTIAEEYKSSLNDLNFNSKPLINMLTMLAEENKKHASLIATTIVNHINSASSESKLPGLYLVDSIMKNVGEHYLKIFCHQITSLFTSVFEKVDESTRSLMFKLRQTWTVILPNKILYNLDTSVKKLDSAWPVTAKNIPKKILAHPVACVGTAEQKSNLDPQSIMKKEDKPKPNTDLLLKKLLADQEQLRQIEVKKVQQTMRKKPLTGIDAIHGKPLKLNRSQLNRIPDIKMVKIKTSPIVTSLKGSSNNSIQRKVAPVIVNVSSPAVEEVAITGKPLLSQSSSSSFTASMPESFDKFTMGQNSAKFSDLQSISQKKSLEKSKLKSQLLENESSKCSSLTRDKHVDKFSMSQNIPSFNPMDLLQQKVTDRTKNKKSNTSRNKSDVSSKSKSLIEKKINLNEKIKNYNKIDKCQNKSKISNKDLTKVSKCSPKKKVIPSGSSKCLELSSNTNIRSHQGRASELKTSKKNKKGKLLTSTDMLTRQESKVSVIEDKKCVISFKNEKMKQNTIVKCNQPPNETFAKCNQPPNETFAKCNQPPNETFAKCNQPPNETLVKCNQPPNETFVKCNQPPNEAFVKCTQPPNEAFVKCNQPPNETFVSVQPPNETFVSVQPPNETFVSVQPPKETIVKCIQPPNETIDVMQSNTQPVVSSVNCMSHKDFKTDSSMQNVVSCLEIPKSEIKENITTNETEKGEPPQKKIKSDDVENLNPDHREPEPPVLFGNQDQDLRKLKDNPILTDEMKVHPVPVNQKVVDEKFLAEKEHLPADFKNIPLSGKYRTLYPRRGRHTNRRILRSRINRDQCLYTADIGSMIKQAKAKYTSGKISENEYTDLRHDLQKMLESLEYQSLTNPASIFQAAHNQRSSKNHVQDYQHRLNIPSEELPIQGPSVIRPPWKPFVLDNKSRFIYFIEDRAFVLMDNNEPRELTFADEPRKVFIEGLMDPLTLRFNGKSVEFEVEGRRHSVRFGVPGHELYINNHPYEANFGGPPIKAMLEDGCLYKIRLMGPPPQVIIGSKPEYELFAKYHRNVDHPSFKKLHEMNELNSVATHSDPLSSGSLQDIDMRIKPEKAQQSDVLLNKDSPFYSEDMKDVDWRIPPSNNIQNDENISDVFRETKNISDNVISLSGIIKQEVKEVPYTEEDNNEPVTSSQEPRNFEWDASTNSKSAVMNVHEREHFIPPNHETWLLKQDDNVNWRHKELSRKNYPGHSVHYQTHPVQCDSTEHLNDQNQDFAGFNRNRLYAPYPRRPMFYNRRMRGRVRGHCYGPWISNNNRPFRPRGRPLILNEPITHRKTLIPFHVRPYPPVSVNYNLPPSVISTTRGHAEKYNENLDDFEQKPLKPQSIESGTSDVNINVESLLEKLIAAGIINTKTDEEPSSEVSSSDCVDTDTVTDNESCESIPLIELNVENLRVHHTGVSSALHSGSQCASCGMRFKEIQGEHYSRHLDWHFRMNRRERDGAKKALSKQWYSEIEDWIQFEEFEVFEERVPSYFELQADNEQSETSDLPAVFSVPATSNDDDSCPICQERFQLFWVEEEEEWHLRNAVRYDDVTYHPACYEDFKKASEADEVHSEDLESCLEEVLWDVSEEVLIILNELLEKVCDEVKIKFSNKDVLPVCSNTMEEVSSVQVEEVLPNEIEEVSLVETEEMTSLEEVILEGKPGEEEIIGVISESDIEADIELPKTETKMVIMQSGGITLKVKAESLQCHSPSNVPEKGSKPVDDKELENDEIDFRPPTPDPNFQVMPPVTKGRELSGLCCIM